MIEIKELSSRRFEALAGYIRRTEIVLCIEEIEWFATLDERLVGMLARDRIDNDFSPPYSSGGKGRMRCSRVTIGSAVVRRVCFIAGILCLRRALEVSGRGRRGR